MASQKVDAELSSVAYRDENRFRSDKGQKTRLPINSPIFIRSDRIAKKPDPDSITDKRGGSARNIHGSTWYTAISRVVVGNVLLGGRRRGGIAIRR